LMARFGKAMRQFGSKELFHLAAVYKPIALEPETDLLNGVSGSPFPVPR
jgi:hypothetical protein